jgi:hypothetical protein
VWIVLTLFGAVLLVGVDVMGNLGALTLPRRICGASSPLHSCVSHSLHSVFAIKTQLGGVGRAPQTISLSLSLPLEWSVGDQCWFWIVTITAALGFAFAIRLWRGPRHVRSAITRWYLGATFGALCLALGLTGADWSPRMAGLFSIGCALGLLSVYERSRTLLGMGGLLLLAPILLWHPPLLPTMPSAIPPSSALQAFCGIALLGAGVILRVRAALPSPGERAPLNSLLMRMSGAHAQ